MAVAVGSVGHILRSAFKPLFPEEVDADATASVAGAASVAAGASVANEGGDEEGEGADDAEAEGEDGGGEQEPAPEAATDDAADDGGDGGSDEGEEGKKEAEEPEPDDPYAGLPEDVRLARMAAEALAPDNLERDVAASAEERAAGQLDAIAEDLTRRVEQSGHLESYLKTQRRDAVMEDAKEAAALRERGLIMNSEVPQGASNLRLDADRMDQYGRFASNLIVARKLLEETEIDALERSGQLTKEAKDIPTFSSMKGQPHYLAGTATNAVREATQADKIERARQRREEKRAKRAAAAQADEEERKAKQAQAQPAVDEYDLDAYEAGKLAAKPNLAPGEGLNGDQKEAEAKVLQRMTHKLNFLRNPRYASKAATGKSGGGSPRSGPAATATGAYSAGQPAFAVHPGEVVFTDYVANQEYSKVLLLRNQTPIGQMVRVLPPSTRFFSMDVAKFPTGGGMVASGMAVKIKIRFMPNSLADYHDKITVVTEGSRFDVVVRSFRPPPELSLPLTLDAGNCMQGDRLEREFVVRNSGGVGSFKIFAEEDWPEPPPASEVSDEADLGPFKIWPTQFSLRSGESMKLNVRFLPMGVGAYERRFVMVCDNCEVTTYTVVGVSCTVDVVCTHMQSRALPVVPEVPLLDAETGEAASVTLMTARSNASRTTQRTGASHGVAPGASVSVAPPAPPRSQAGCVAGSPAKGDAVSTVVSKAPSVAVPSLSFAAEVSPGGPSVVVPSPTDSLLARPPLRFRYDPVPPGAVVTKTFVLSNRTPLELKFSWKLKRWSLTPPVPPKRKRAHRHGYGGLTNRSGTTNPAGQSAASVSQMASGRASSGHGGSPQHGSPNRESEAVPASAAEDAPLCFEMYPSSGVLPPHGSLSFSATFSPEAVEVYETVAEFVVHDMPKKPVEEELSSPVHRDGGASAALSVVVEGSAQASATGSAQSSRPPTGDASADQSGVVAVAAAEIVSSEEAPIVREDVSAATVFLQGAGRAAEVVVAPAVIEVPGAMVRGGVAVHRVRITNYGIAPTSFTFGAAQVVDTHAGLAAPVADESASAGHGPVPPLPVLSLADGFGDQRDAPKVRVSPASGTIAPMAYVDVEVVATAREVGEYWMSLPVQVPHGPEKGLAIRMHAAVEGARVRIVDPEVDFGLVGVGGHMSRTVSIRNLSPLPASWSFRQTAKDQLLPSPSLAVTPAVTARSMEEPEQQRAVLAFEPSHGVLAPGAEAQVSVSCHAGSKPQRLREMFECRVADGNTSYCRVRGEVQSPKVHLDTFSMRLGTCFVGVPVERKVTLTNLSNLLADWAFDLSETLTDTEFFSVEFSPSQGTLSEKGKQEVTVTFHPKKPGRVEALLACDVRGMAFPLGFSVMCYTKGLVVVFSLEDPYKAEREAKARIKAAQAAEAAGADDDEEPAGVEGPARPGSGDRLIAGMAGLQRARSSFKLASKRAADAKVDAPVDPAELLEREVLAKARALGGEVGVVPAVNFGDDFPTFGSRKMTLRLHNASGIPTSFTVEVEKYKSKAAIEMGKVGLTAVVNGGASGTASGMTSAGNTGRAPVPPAGGPAGTATSPQKLAGITFKSGTLSGSATGQSTRKGRKLLGTKHERTAKFQSKNGQTMLVERDNKSWMTDMLEGGRGLAVDVQPMRRLQLPAWGTVEMEVTCVGDMPGVYRDSLLVDVDGQDIVKVPIAAGIVGSPLQLTDNVVGLQLGHATPVLTWGDVLIGAPESSKVFHVQNTAPKYAKVSWKVRPDHKEEPPVVAVAWNVAGGFNSSAPVYLQMTAYSDELAAPPFAIEPASATLPPRGMASFTVTARPEPPPDLTGGNMTARSSLLSGDAVGEEALPPPNGEARGMLVCDAKFVDSADSVEVEALGDEGEGEEEAKGGDDGGAAEQKSDGPEGKGSEDAPRPSGRRGSVQQRRVLAGKTARRRGSTATGDEEGDASAEGAPLAAAASMPGCLNIRAVINPVQPKLSVDKREGKDGVPFVKFSIWSTHPRSHPSYMRQITLTNSQSAALTFAMDIFGPFELADTVSNAPMHPLSGNTTGSLHRPPSASQSTRLFTLPPHYNVVCDVKFLLDEAMREEAARTGGQVAGGAGGAGAESHFGAADTGTLARTSVLDSAAAKLKYDFRGRIKITFSNGHVQWVGVRADYLRPMVAVSRALHNFGHCHTESTKDFEVFLANPTEVDAEWKVEHVPAPPPKPRVTIDVSSLGLDGIKGIDVAALSGAAPEGPATIAEEDDPSVFEFSLSSGVLTGPTAPLQVAETLDLRNADESGRTSLLPIKVTFNPRLNVHYKSRFRFRVRKGEAFDVVLRGHGSYMEEEVVIDGRPSAGPVEL